MTSTVREVTFDLLRTLGVTTMFGNPGSTEETFLKDFPADFTYVQTLAEASAVGAADGYSQAMRSPVLVNVHTSAGLSNGMSNILTAYMNRTPLIVTAGNQTREMLRARSPRGSHPIRRGSSNSPRPSRPLTTPR